MAGTSRASLPEEFFDRTSEIVLQQPEPQYVYANLLYAAMGNSLAEAQQLGLPIPGRQFGAEAASYDIIERDRLMLADPINATAIRAISELGNGVGHTVRLNRPFFPNTTYTEASRKIPVGSSISTTGIAVSSEQTSITCYRYGGPYDGSAVAPYAIERFDAQFAVHSMAQIHGANLKRDYDRFKDAQVSALLDLATNVIRPKGYATDASMLTDGAAIMDWNTITRTAAVMDEANIPVFADGKRVLVLSPTQIQQLQDDAQFLRAVEKHPTVNPVLNPGFYATAGEFHIFKSTTLVKDTATVAGVTITRAHAFGPGVLGAAWARLPEVVHATDDNYGETAKVIWLEYSGLQLLDNRFVVSVRTTGTPTSTD